jgi:hypothetical protein
MREKARNAIPPTIERSVASADPMVGDRPAVNQASAAPSATMIGWPLIFAMSLSENSSLMSAPMPGRGSQTRRKSRR